MGILTPALVCRPALPLDTPQVLALTARIWDGGDYIPYVWEDWLASPRGLLAVAELEGQIVGLYKLSKVRPGDYWLEGLRTHVDFQRRGIATHLHRYLLDYWQRKCLEPGKNAIRLATASTRTAVHRLSANTGFHKVLETQDFAAPALEGEAAAQAAAYFQSTPIDECDLALAFARSSELLRRNAGLQHYYWRWPSLHRSLLEKAIRQQRCWWWREKRGLLVQWVDYEEEHGQKIAYPHIQFVAGELSDLRDILHDARGLAGSLGYLNSFWMAPKDPDILGALAAAGYIRPWQEELFIFEKFVESNLENMV